MSRRRVLLLISISLLIALASMLWRYLTNPLTTSFSISKAIMSSIGSTTNPILNGAAGKPKVIIVGSGLAGLSAASELVARNIPVHMLERFPKPGGNSIKASSGINGAPTKYQPGPPYSDTSFYADSVKSAGTAFTSSSVPLKHAREALISVLTNESAPTIEWLTQTKGVDLSVVAQLGGHSYPRTHRGAGQTPPGASLVLTLLKQLKESPLFELDTDCLVTSVLKSASGHGVAGVEYTCASRPELGTTDDAPTHALKMTLHGPVIFASGGFAGDTDSAGMLATYRPDLVGLPSTNAPRPGSQALLTSVGAQLLDMDQVQIHPTSFIDPADASNPVKFLAAELLRGEGGVLLHEGKRFVNEMETRKRVTAAITALPVASSEGATSPKQWNIDLVLDEGVFANASSHIGFYVYKGLMRKTTLGELGPAALATVQAYADAVKGETADAYGRTYFGHWELLEPRVESVVYVGRITPAIHFTMGGVVISPGAEVLNEEGKAIQGLWAAGEVTGGVHGENRLGGSSLLECVVFGRRAGKEAARYLEESS